MESTMMKLSAFLLLTLLPLSSARTIDHLRQGQPAETVADNGQVNQPPPPPIKSAEGSVLEWVAWTDSLPNNAVSIDNDREGRTDYVCKFRCHAGFYTPTKGAYCYYVDVNREHAASAFEILVNRDNFEILGWEDGSYGSVPKNSVKTCPGEKIYVGKNKYGLGKVDVKQKVFFLPWRGSWYTYDDYQVLTISQDVVKQKVHDIRYIRDRAKVINFPPEIKHKTMLSNLECNPVKKTDKLTVTSQVTHQWNIDGDVASYHKTSLQAAIPLVSFELGHDFFFQYSEGNTVTDTITDGISFDITAPPSHSCTINVMRYTSKRTIPFTARLSRTYANWDVHTTAITGTYSSFQVGELRAIVDRCIPLNDTTPCHETQTPLKVYGISE